MEENDTSYDSGEDSLEVASKTWNRAINAASKTGYREGKEDGSQSVFQEGFDIAYQHAFKTAFSIGAYKGLASCLPKDLSHPAEIENILSHTHSGICFLCEKESQGSTDIFKRSIAEIESCQLEHPKRILKILEDYFNPLLKEHHINFKA